MRKREAVIPHIVQMIKSRAAITESVANELAEKIFKEVVEVAVDDERQEWIMLSSARPTDFTTDDFE